MIGNKKCPYCEKTFERGLVSGESDIYPDIKYIGCAECGKTSILYKNNDITPIMGDPNSSTIELVKKDIDKAFAKAATVPIFVHDHLNNKIDNKGENEMFKGVEGELQMEDIKSALEKQFPGAKVTMLGGPMKEENLSMDDEEEREALKRIMGSVIKDIIGQAKETIADQPVMACRTFTGPTKEEEEEVKVEERKSYLVIDDYDDEYTYLNVTLDELARRMDEDHNIEEEDLQLFELKPVEFSVKKTIEIR